MENQVKFGFRLKNDTSDDLPTFVLSDDTVDSVGDIIEASGWDLSRFNGRSANPIALWNHNHNDPIGTWEAVKVEGNRLLGKLKLAAAGTSETVDKVRKLIAQKVLVAVSVGFRPQKWEPIENSREGGYRYQKQTLLECSVVTVPANPNAVLVRSYNPGLTTAESERLLAEAVRASLVPATGSRAKYGASTTATGQRNPTTGGTAMKTLADQIQTLQDEIITLQDEIAPLHDKNKTGEELTDEEATLFDETNSAIEEREKKLERLRKTEKALGTSTALNAAHRSQLPTPGVVTDPTMLRRGNGGDPRDLLVRMAVLHFRARAQNTSIEALRATMYPERAELEAVVKAVTNPAQTTVAGWAAELVETAVADFLDSLRQASVYGALRGMGASFTFGRNGAIKIPSRAKARRAPGDLAGAFVGEGQPIPVRRGSTASVSLVPHKMGVISTYTREMAAHSTPAIEALIREGILEDTAIAIDAALLDAVAADAIRPAGLLNGVTPIAGTAGGGIAAITADIAAAMAPFINANGADRLVWLINPSKVFSLTWVSTAVGVYPFKGEAEGGTIAGYPYIASTAVPADQLILVRAADFATAAGDTPSFDISDVATIHEEDGSYPVDEAMRPGTSTVLPITTGAAGAAVAATPVRSLWQTASIGIRMLLDIDWAMRRPGMVSVVDGITW